MWHAHNKTVLKTAVSKLEIFMEIKLDCIV